MIASTLHASAPATVLSGAGAGVRVGAAARAPVMDGVLCAGLLVYLSTLAFEGPLRWGLALAGLGNLLYVRDAIPVASLAFLLLRALIAQRQLLPAIVLPGAILVVHACIALMLGIEPFSILFGMKIFMFIPYGMAMWPLVRARLRSATVATWVVYGVSLVAVFLNLVLERFPWESMAYDTAFGTMSTTWQWWDADGNRRLPGLARASFNTATILGCTGVLVMVSLRPALLRLLVAALTLWAIVLTTSKGMILAFSIASLWLVMPDGPVHGRIGRLLLQGFAALTLCLPLLVVGLGLGSGVTAADLPNFALSLWERFESMWPRAFELLPGGVASLLGGGLGSIGTPQWYSAAWHQFNAGDNLAVYLLIDFGLAGVLYYLLPVLAAGRVAREAAPRLRLAYLGLLVAIYGYGVSNNMVEDSFCCILLGLAMGLGLVREKSSEGGRA